MRTVITRVALALCLCTQWYTTVATATEVGGGGGKSVDCLVTLDAAVSIPLSRPRHVRCTDGDPVCDTDATINGLCSFDLSICANSTFEPSCSLNGVDSIVIDNAIDNGDPKFDPDFQALQAAVDSQIQPPTATDDDCTLPTTIIVPIKGPIGNNRCRPGRKKVKMTSLSEVIGGKIYKDRDRIRFICDPAPTGCDPATLFSGTFDRIQRQVFNQNCATSGCHDSETQAGNLLLETGASYGSLVNGVPSNFAASGAGWLLVDAPNPPGTSGTPENSFLHRKIQGDLPDATYGSRMPLNKSRLHRTLRDVIELWIAAGAPQTGWVPGTD